MENGLINDSVLFSVIVPIYNNVDYLDNCIKSILSQTYGHYELILVNDGSTDSSHIVCCKYSENKHVRYINKPNGGVSSARNAGLKIAFGDYIVFVDSDDILMSDALYVYSLAIQAYAPDIVKAGYIKEYWDRRRNIISTKEEKIIKDHGEMLHEIIANSYEGFLWNSAFRKEVIGDLLFDENLDYLEDHVFSCNVFSRCKSMVLLPQPVYKYIIYERKSLSSVSDPFKILNSVICLYHARLNLIKDSSSFDSAKRECVKDIKEPVYWALQTIYTLTHTYSERRAFANYLLSNELKTDSTLLLFRLRHFPFVVSDFLYKFVFFRMRIIKKIKSLK